MSRSSETLSTRLEGKVALISGAARGIGRGIAFELAAAGADVAFLDLPDSARAGAAADAAETLAGVEARGRRGLFMAVDAADREAVRASVAQCADELGGVDIAVANAGYNVRQPVAEADWDVVRRIFEVVQHGTYHLGQAAAQQMLKQAEERGSGTDGAGAIIAISSVHDNVPVATNAAYSMAKTAVNAFVRVLAVELAANRIRVNSINPGWIDTPGERAFLPDEEIQRQAKHLPWGRLGTPADIGRAVVFLASDDAEYITGHTLLVDGGLVVAGALRSE